MRRATPSRRLRVPQARLRPIAARVRAGQQLFGHMSRLDEAIAGYREAVIGFAVGRYETGLRRALS